MWSARKLSIQSARRECQQRHVDLWFSLEFQKGREALPVMLTRFAADDLVEIVAAHREVVGAVVVMRVALLLEQLGVLLKVCSFKLVLRNDAMAMETIAAGRQTASTALPLVVFPVALRAGSWRWCLHVTSVGVHWHLLANLRDALLIIDVFASGQLTDGAGLLLEAAVRWNRILAARPANTKRSRLVGIGPGDRHDALLGAHRRQ